MTTTATRASQFCLFDSENNSFARSALASFFFGRLKDLLVSSMTWNHLFCSCVVNVSIWRQMLDFVLFLLKNWFQMNSSIIRAHFAGVMTFNNWELINQIGFLNVVPNSNSLGLKRFCLRNFHITYTWMPNYNANTTCDDTILLVEPITSLHVHMLNLAFYCPKSWSRPLDQLSLGPRILHFSWCPKWKDKALIDKLGVFINGKEQIHNSPVILWKKNRSIYN